MAALTPGATNPLLAALARMLRERPAVDEGMRGPVEDAVVAGADKRALVDAMRREASDPEQAGKMMGAAGYAAPIAWHGSPHVFDRFRMDKIGTGEGAQAYGHGLYFTSDPKVAEVYRSKLAPVEIKGEPHGSSTRIDPYNPEQLVRSEISNSIRFRGKSPAEAISSVKERTKEYLEYLRKYNSYGDSEDAARSLAEKVSEAERKLAHLDTIRPEDIKTSGGTLHAVDIPDDLMDFSKKLSEHSPKMKERIQRIVDQFADDAQRPYTGEDYWGSATGYEFYNWLTERAGRGDTLSSEAKALRASGILRDAGIPGHAYVGETSGVRNYVMYDEDAIKPVVKKPSLESMKPLIDLLRSDK